MKSIKFLTWVIIFLFSITIVIAVSIIPQQRINYREVRLTDLPQLRDIYNFGLNKGGWCGLPPNEVGNYGIIKMYQELQEEYGENMGTAVRLNNGNVEGMMVYFIIEDRIYYKAFIFDMRLPEQQWNDIMIGLTNYTAQIAKSKGVKYFRTNANKDTWVYNAVVGHIGGQLVDGNMLEASIEGYEKRTINYSAKFNYIARIRNMTLENQEDLPENLFIVDDHTVKEGNFYTIYSSQIAYKRNNVWQIIRTNPEEYKTLDGEYYVDYLNLSIGKDGLVKYKGLNISLFSIRTSINSTNLLSESIPNRYIVQDKNHSISFENISGLNIDYEIQLTTNGFKLNTIIKERPAIQLTNIQDGKLFLIFKLTGNTGVIEKIKDSFLDNSLAYDNVGRTQKIRKNITQINNQWYIIESVPLGWLLEEASYPVKLDPTTDLTSGEDFWVRSFALSSIGNWYLKFNFSAISGSGVLSAYLNLTFYSVEDDFTYYLSTVNMSSNWTDSMTCAQWNGSRYGVLQENMTTISLTESGTGTFTYNVNGTTHGVAQIIPYGGWDSTLTLYANMGGHVSHDCNEINNGAGLHGGSLLKDADARDSEYATASQRPHLLVETYSCSANGAACSIDANCCSGRCDGTCQAKLGTLSACDEASDCTSNYCRTDYDGVGQFCAGSSTSCVYDNPTGGSAEYNLATGYEQCSGDGYKLCTNGVWGSNVDCGDASCSADGDGSYTAINDSICLSGASGGCTAQSNTDCGDYSCNGLSCYTSCYDRDRTKCKDKLFCNTTNVCLDYRTPPGGIFQLFPNGEDWDYHVTEYGTKTTSGLTHYFGDDDHDVGDYIGCMDFNTGAIYDGATITNITLVAYITGARDTSESRVYGPTGTTRYGTMTGAQIYAIGKNGTKYHQGLLFGTTGLKVIPITENATANFTALLPYNWFTLCLYTDEENHGRRNDAQFNSINNTNPPYINVTATGYGNGCNPPASGSWEINGTEICYDRNITLVNGHVQLRSGDKLVLVNVTFEMDNSANYDYDFNVYLGGELEAYDSYFKEKNNQYIVQMTLYGYSYLENSTFYFDKWFMYTSTDALNFIVTSTTDRIYARANSKTVFRDGYLYYPYLYSEGGNVLTIRNFDYNSNPINNNISGTNGFQFNMTKMDLNIFGLYSLGGNMILNNATTYYWYFYPYANYWGNATNSFIYFMLFYNNALATTSTINGIRTPYVKDSSPLNNRITSTNNNHVNFTNVGMTYLRAYTNGASAVTRINNSNIYDLYSITGATTFFNNSELTYRGYWYGTSMNYISNSILSASSYNYVYDTAIMNFTLPASSMKNLRLEAGSENPQIDGYVNITSLQSWGAGNTLNRIFPFYTGRASGAVTVKDGATILQSVPIPSSGNGTINITQLSTTGAGKQYQIYLDSYNVRNITILNSTSPIGLNLSPNWCYPELHGIWNCTRICNIIDMDYNVSANWSIQSGCRLNLTTTTNVTFNSTNQFIFEYGGGEISIENNSSCC